MTSADTPRLHGNNRLRIKGGKVYDPANNVHGEVRDVCVSGGRVVDAVKIPGRVR